MKKTDLIYKIFILISVFIFARGSGWGQTITQTFNSSGSFTPPAGVYSIVVECWGGGGAGGGNADNANDGGAGGGAGGAYASSIVTVIPLYWLYCNCRYRWNRRNFYWCM